MPFAPEIIPSCGTRSTSNPAPRICPASPSHSPEGASPSSSVGVGGTADAAGVLMMLVSVFLWSTASIIIRRISGRYDPMQIALIAICCALPLTGAWSLIELQSAACSFSVQSVLAVLYMGIFGTAVTHSLWKYSLRVMDASFCSMFYPMQPLVSAILGVLFLHETVTPSFILGALMICGGIVAAVKSAPK